MLPHMTAGARERDRGLETVCSAYQNEPHLGLLGVDPGKRLFTGQLDTDIYSSLFMISHCPWQAVCELTGGPQPEQTARERRLIGTDPRTTVVEKTEGPTPLADCGWRACCPGEHST